MSGSALLMRRMFGGLGILEDAKVEGRLLLIADTCAHASGVRGPRSSIVSDYIMKLACGGVY